MEYRLMYIITHIAYYVRTGMRDAFVVTGASGTNPRQPEPR